MLSRYFIHNGVISDFEKETENLLALLDKSFELTETIWFCHNKIPLFEQHIQSLNEVIDLLNLPKHQYIEDAKELLRVSKRLINKNKAFQSGILKYTFVWKNKATKVYITCTPFKEKHFRIVEDGALCTYAENVKHSGTPLGRFYFINEIPWKSLKSQTEKTRFQNLLLTNEDNAITEGLETNVFFY